MCEIWEEWRGQQGNFSKILRCWEYEENMMSRLVRRRARRWEMRIRGRSRGGESSGFQDRSLREHE